MGRSDRLDRIQPSIQLPSLHVPPLRRGGQDVLCIEILGEGAIFFGNSFRISLSQMMFTLQLGRAPLWNKSKSAIALYIILHSQIHPFAMYTAMLPVTLIHNLLKECRFF